MRHWILSVLVLALMAGLAGCNNKTQPQKQSNEKIEITGKYWKFVSLNGRDISARKHQEKTPHFILQEEENRVSGNTGCNLLSGTYTLTSDNEIEFSPLAVTKMACAGRDYEQEFLDVLSGNVTYSLQDNILTLENSNNKGKASFHLGKE